MTLDRGCELLAHPQRGSCNSRTDSQILCSFSLIIFSSYILSIDTKVGTTNGVLLHCHKCFKCSPSDVLIQHIKLAY